MANHLQFIGASIGFYRTSLTLLVQEKRSAENGQWRIFRQFFKKIFFDWFFSKVNHKRTPLFFVVSHGEHVSKVIHFGEKVQNHKKICQKSWLFRKNLIFVTSNSPHFWWSIHAPALRPFYGYWVKKSKTFDFVAVFQKMSTRDVFCQAYTWYPKFFYVKKTKIFKLWFLAQKVFKMA